MATSTSGGAGFRLLFKAKFKTEVENPALESEVDRSMVEDRDSVEEVRMVMEASSASQNPGNCGELDIYNGGNGGLVSGEEIIVINEQTQDFEIEKLTTLSMNDTTVCFEKIMEPGLSAEDIMDKEK